jgi:hypothetical protein
MQGRAQREQLVFHGLQGLLERRRGLHGGTFLR